MPEMGTTDSSPADRSERSHYVRSPAPWVAGCSDIGLRHRTNQDAMSLAAHDGPPRTAILAVSDGVTTAPGSELASLVAVDACTDSLIAGHRDGQPTNLAFVQAFDEANRAVLEAREEPSACTLIAAWVDGETISVGNVGDSRAYWLGDDGSCQLLSTDDSMAQARIMLGMSRLDAERSSQAHALTRWLGRDSSNVTPSVITRAAGDNGWLLLCSDGLWNYASSPDEMSALFASLVRGGASPTSLTEALVAWANAQGGRDNITAALARIER